MLQCKCIPARCTDASFSVWVANCSPAAVSVLLLRVAVQGSRISRSARLQQGNWCCLCSVSTVSFLASALNSTSSMRCPCLRPKPEHARVKQAFHLQCAVVAVFTHHCGLQRGVCCIGNCSLVRMCQLPEFSDLPACCAGWQQCSEASCPHESFSIWVTNCGNATESVKAHWGKFAKAGLMKHLWAPMRFVLLIHAHAHASTSESIPGVRAFASKAILRK